MTVHFLEPWVRPEPPQKRTETVFFTDTTLCSGCKHARGEKRAYLYGAEASGEYSALNSFFLLTDRPAVYNLPEVPRRPAAKMTSAYALSYAASLGLAVFSAFLLMKRAE